LTAGRRAAGRAADGSATDGSATDGPAADGPAGVAIINLGCPKNLVDSEVMAALVGRAGLALTGDPADADAIVINTCAFIGPARDEAWEEIARAARLRREGPCRALVVAGCLVQGFGEEVRRRFPEVDQTLGTGDVEEVPRVLERLLSGARAGEAGDRPASEAGYLPAGPAPRLLSTPPHYAYLKIAEGCGHRCAFCLIPALRGRYRSRPPADLVEEARALETLGVKELILVAQDTTVYGRDLGGRPLLADLVGRLLSETGLAWLRVLYAYPSTLTDDFVALLGAGQGRLCRYLDLPMQHASDPILRAMRRPETGDFLLRLVERLRRSVPGLVLRSTFIVGFPGETEKDFQALLGFLEAARLEHAGFFAYSREAGTRAADLPGQVDEETKAERFSQAAGLQREIAGRYRRGLVGRTLRVIVEETRAARRGLTRGAGRVALVARSEFDAPDIDGQVRVRWPAAVGVRPSPGDFLDVRVVKSSVYDVVAVPVDEPG